MRLLSAAQGLVKAAGDIVFDVARLSELIAQPSDCGRKRTAEPRARVTVASLQLGGAAMNHVELAVGPE